MLRRVLSFSLIFILLWVSIGYAETQGRTWKLSDEEIQQAIELGKEAKNNISLLDEWVIGYPSNSPGLIDMWKTHLLITTLFRSLASEAWGKWKKYQELTQEEIEERLISFEAKLMIAVVFYGDEIDFAKDYHCVIKIGDKIIQPSYIQNEDEAEKTIIWPFSPAYKAMNFYIFSTADIPRDAVIQVIAIGDKEETFTVDLSKMR
jgi:hypothetical protein